LVEIFGKGSKIKKREVKYIENLEMMGIKESIKELKIKKFRGKI